MSAKIRHTWITMMGLLFIISISSSIAQAQAGCTPFPRSAATFNELQQAISCYSLQTTSGTYEINITANILLTDNTLTILNANPNIDLVINGGGNAVDGDHSYRPFTIAADTVVTMEFLTIRNGFAEDGGGIYNDGGTVNLNDSIITNNYASRLINSTTDMIHGGGIYNNAGNVTLTNTIVLENNVTNAIYAYGGGIYNSGGTVTLIRSDLTGNHIIGDNVAAGGGIYSEDGTVTVHSSPISGNTASGQVIFGGGIYNQDGSLTVTATAIVGNSASGSDRGEGGGIHNYQGTLSLADTLLNDNVASGGRLASGGGIYSWGHTSTVTITSSTFHDNSVIAGSTASGGGIVCECNTLIVTNSSIRENIVSGDLKGYGGAITFGGDSLTVSNSTISSNSVTAIGAGGGGGIQVGGSTVLIEDSTISDNAIISTFEGGGAGIRSLYSTITMTNTTLTGNTITSDVFGGGGGIYADGGSVSITNSSLNENSVTGAELSWGGSIYGRDTVIDIHGTISNNNRVSGEDARGGGIYSLTSTVVVTDSALNTNTATGEDVRGGGIFGEEVTLTVVNSTFAGNLVTGDDARGGGIFTTSVPSVHLFEIIIANSTLSGNVASGESASGGGIYNEYSALTVTNSTFHMNLVTSAVGGVDGIVHDSAPNIQAPLSLTNTIISDSGGIIACIGNPVQFNGLNLIEDGSCGAASNGQLTGDPLLAPLAYNGGTTQTHALLPNSPAIDVGVNALAIDADGNPLIYDQRGAGFPRISGDTVDLGAFEFECTLPAVVSTEVELNDAIACYNQQTAPGTYEINIAANITLTANTTTIFKPNFNFELIINGGGYVIDGGSSYRPFRIGSQTNVTIDNLTIQNGNARDGGGIYNDGGRPTIINTTISDNTALNGGGIYTRGGLVTIINTTLSNNIAGSGGGIYSDRGIVRAFNTTISNNTADSGGIYAIEGTVMLTNTTLSDNQPIGSGQGSILSFSGTLVLTNSIIANSFPAPDCVIVSGTITFTGLNLIEDGSCGAAANGQLTGDPMLGPLADNGGATLTHALLPGSPAIDVGVNALAVDSESNPLLFDQRGTGFPRINNGTVDLGAYEAPAPDPCTGLSPNVDNDVRNGDTHLNSPYNNGDVHNTSDCFDYEVSIAVYKILDTPGSPHLLHDAQTMTVSAGQTINISLDLPDCMVEVYLFYGPVIDNFDNETYAAQGRELDSVWLNGTGPCPDPFGGGGGDPDPDPDPPVCTPNPDGDLKQGGSHLNPPFDSGTVTNLSNACTYEVGIASYAVIDGGIDTQQLLGSQTMSIGPGQTVNLGPVPLAEGCSTQVDLFYGGVITDFSGGARYGNRLLDVRWVGSGNCGG